MLARAYIRAARTYVDPFDRICHGLRSLLAPATTDPKEARFSVAERQQRIEAHTSFHMEAGNEGAEGIFGTKRILLRGTNTS